MHAERRVVLILALLALIAVPAAVLRVLCVGRSCEEEQTRAAQVPFCSLPAPIRDRIAAGYRDGRSPDVLAVTKAESPVTGGSGAPGAPDLGPWPAVGDPPTVPIVFWGRGVTEDGSSIEAGLEDISPTAAEIMGFQIPHPEVRSGRPIAGVATGDPPRLFVYLILEAPVADEAFVRDRANLGTADFEGTVPSLPTDRAAQMATIGTGGTPAQHGITGAFVRDNEGSVVPAWGAGDESDPGTVIATLADDLDEELNERPRIALIGRDPRDLGLVGGDWYVDVDEDLVLLSEIANKLPDLRTALASGLGRNDVPDVLAIVMRGTTLIDRIERAIERATDGSAAYVMTALPVQDAPPDTAVSPDLVREIEEQVTERVGGDVVDLAVPGGLFLDQEAIAEQELSRQDVVAALRNVTIDGNAAFTDAFPGFAVALARFC